jgi:hypothetical protein
VENFRNLEAKLNDKFNEVHAIVSVDTNRETWNKTLNELQFNILPSLRRQINTLANLLNPSELQDDIDGSTLELIIEIQSRLDHTLGQIFLIAAGIKPNPVLAPSRRDENDLKGFKECRSEALLYQLRTSNTELGFFL